MSSEDLSKKIKEEILRIRNNITTMKEKIDKFKNEIREGRRKERSLDQSLKKISRSSTDAKDDKITLRKDTTQIRDEIRNEIRDLRNKKNTIEYEMKLLERKMVILNNANEKLKHGIDSVKDLHLEEKEKIFGLYDNSSDEVARFLNFDVNSELLDENSNRPSIISNSLNFFPGNVYSLCFSPDSSRICTVGWSNDIYFFSPEQLTAKEEKERVFVYPGVDSSESTIKSVCYYTSKLLLTGSVGHVVRLWNLETGKTEALEGHKDEVNSVQAIPNSSFAVSGSKDATLRLWDLEQKKEVTQFTREEYLRSSERVLSVFAREMGQSNHTIIGGGYSKGQVRLFESNSPQNPIKTFNDHTDSVNSVRCHGDYLFASCSGDKTIHVYDFRTMKKLITFTDFSSSVTCVDFDPDGKFLVSSSYDESVKLFSIEKKCCIFGANSHQNYVHTVRFSPDGKHIASGAGGGRVVVWDFEKMKRYGQEHNPYGDMVLRNLGESQFEFFKFGESNFKEEEVEEEMVEVMVVAYDFDPEDEEELPSSRMNEILVRVPAEYDSDEWVQCRKEDGKKGYIPWSFIEKLGRKPKKEVWSSDISIVIESVKQDGTYLQFASKEMKNVKEVVIQAVRQNGNALQYAGEDLKKDKEVILEAVKQNKDAIQYASEEIRKQGTKFLTLPLPERLDSSFESIQEILKSSQEEDLSKEDDHVSDIISGGEEIIEEIIEEEGEHSNKEESFVLKFCEVCSKGLNDRDRSIKNLKKYISHNENSVSCRLQLGQTELERGRLGDAKETFENLYESLKENEPSKIDSEVIEHLSSIEMKNNCFEKASQHIENFLERRSNTSAEVENSVLSRLHLKHSICRQREGDQEESLKSLNRCVDVANRLPRGTREKVKGLTTALFLRSKLKSKTGDSRGSLSDTKYRNWRRKKAFWS